MLRRMLLVLSVAALMAAGAMPPAFARAEHYEEPGTIDGQPPVAVDCKGVITPSGNDNLKCSSKPKGGNKGGSGGGGATVTREPGQLKTGIGDAQVVQTPSGNVNASGHLHP